MSRGVAVEIANALPKIRISFLPNWMLVGMGWLSGLFFLAPMASLLLNFHLLLRWSHLPRPAADADEGWWSDVPRCWLVNISVDEFLIYGSINFSSVNL